MFEDESEFKELVDRLDIDTEPNVTHRKNLRCEMLSTFSKTRPTRRAETTATDARQTITRAIVKSRIARLAAAAVILVAVIIGLQHYTGSIGLTTPAFSQVIENMQRMKWIYFFKEDLQDGTIREQAWACPESQILMGIGTKGWVCLVDCKAKRKYTYSPQQGAVEVSYLEDDFGGMYRMYVSSPLGLVDEIIQMHRKEDAYITRQKATYNGRDAIVYRFEVGLSADAAEISNWVVDAETHLPIINEVVRVTAEGEVMRSHRFAFDYPETGPKDIYDLGVPHDANIIDKAPEPEVEEILKTYHNYKDETLKRYMAIISIHNKPVYIEYSDEAHRRLERYDLKINAGDWIDNRDFYSKQMGDTFDSVLHWLKNKEVMTCAFIELHDGIFYYEIDAGDMRDGKPPSRSREYSLRGQLVHIGWPRIEFEGNIVENDYSRDNGLICIEQKYSRKYINPQRGYIRERSERLNGKPRIEVVEFGQTESGHWYPKKIEGADGTKTVYLKENPEFPENIFSPKSLPNYAEWESNDVEAGLVIRKPSPDSNDVPAYEGFTPLHMAAFTGNMESAKSLLAAGADVNPRFNSGATPMELAAAGGRLDIIKLLFEHGAGFTSLEGHCALAPAVDGGNLEVVRFMLDNGVDVNGFYKDGETALHHAAEQAKTEFVRLLLQYGADVEIKAGRYDQYTPLFRAVQKSRHVYHNSRMKDYVETARVLLEAGADVDTRSDRVTPLLHLCQQLETGGFVNMDLLKLFIEYGADLNFSRDGSQTPLIHAVQAKNVEAVGILLEAGADPFTEPNSIIPRPIALYVAAGLKAKEIEQLLRKYMEPRLSQTNNAIRAGVLNLLNAIRNADFEEAVKHVCIESPLYGDRRTWMQNIKTLYDDYVGHYELFDEILSIRFQSGFGEVIINPPQKGRKEYLLIELMRYPDDTWKVTYWYSRRLRNLDNLWDVPNRDSRRHLEDYRKALFKAAEKTEN